MVAFRDTGVPVSVLDCDRRVVLGATETEDDAIGVVVGTVEANGIELEYSDSDADTRPVDAVVLVLDGDGCFDKLVEADSDIDEVMKRDDDWETVSDAEPGKVNVIEEAEGGGVLVRVVHDIDPDSDTEVVFEDDADAVNVPLRLPDSVGDVDRVAVDVVVALVVIEAIDEADT